jgi:hypothetical protein
VFHGSRSSRSGKDILAGLIIFQLSDDSHFRRYCDSNPEVALPDSGFLIM